MKKNILLIFILQWSVYYVSAQYYNSAFGYNGLPLKSALHNIIKNHTVLTYADLWTAFQQTDKKPDNTVWDIYTDVPGGVPAISFQFVVNQCGNYNAEGDCYNREHTWPKEKFGGDDTYPMYSDLHQVYPTDGWVNNKRAAYPYGNVNTVTYTSVSNQSKLGNSSTYSGYTDKVFEPVDSFKGDLARAYFYMSTRYQNEDAGWDNWTMANGAELTQDAISLLLSWHHNDPVSQKETDRNAAVALLQNNRNPFIDYPLFADCIWGNGDCSSLGLSHAELDLYVTIFPVPVHNELHIKTDSRINISNMSIYDLCGREVFSIRSTVSTDVLNISSLPQGNYLLMMNTSQGVYKKVFSKN